MPPEIRAVGIEGLPEVQAGDDLAAQIMDAAAAQGTPIEQGDVLVVTQKIVSKAEGRVMTIDEVEASPLAIAITEGHRRDPRHTEMILRESRRVVRMDPRRDHQRDLPRLHLRQRRHRRLQHPRLRLHLPAARGPRRLGPAQPRQRS